MFNIQLFKYINAHDPCLSESNVFIGGLTPGEISDLLSEEEVDGVRKAVRSEVRELSLLDNNENCWNFFMNRVRQQLKVSHH